MLTVASNVITHEPQSGPACSSIEKAENILSETKHDIEGILALENLKKDDDNVIYLSGSLVEGLGNSGSDIDIFVVGSANPSGEFIINKRYFSISVHYLGSRRVDFEYWPRSVVKDIAYRLNQIEVGSEFVAEKLSQPEELFIHRLFVGLPLKHPDFHDRLKRQFDLDRFRAYLIQQSIHRIDGALEDLVGMLDDGKLDDGLLRAVDLVGLSLDTLGYSQGNTNTLPKWRGAIAKRLTSPVYGKEVVVLAEQFWQLIFPDSSKHLQTAANATAYIRSCIDYSERVVACIQQ